MSFIRDLPRRYADTVRGINGVQSATWANWFGAKLPSQPNEFFASMAVDTDSFFTVYNEMVVPPDAMTRWREDRRGAIVGDVLARKMSWRVGDRVSLRGTIYPGDWEFTVDGIYTATRRSVDRSQFIFHYRYLNDAIPPRGATASGGWSRASTTRRAARPSHAPSTRRLTCRTCRPPR